MGSRRRRKSRFSFPRGLADPKESTTGSSPCKGGIMKIRKRGLASVQRLGGHRSRSDLQGQEVLKRDDPMLLRGS